MRRRGRSWLATWRASQGGGHEVKAISARTRSIARSAWAGVDLKVTFARFAALTTCAGFRLWCVPVAVVVVVAEVVVVAVTAATFAAEPPTPNARSLTRAAPLGVPRPVEVRLPALWKSLA